MTTTQEQPNAASKDAPFHPLYNAEASSARCRTCGNRFAEPELVHHLKENLENVVHYTGEEPIKSHTEVAVGVDNVVEGPSDRGEGGSFHYRSAICKPCLAKVLRVAASRLDPTYP